MWISTPAPSWRAAPDQGATWTHAVIDPDTFAFLPQICTGAGTKRIYATDVWAGKFNDDANMHREFASLHAKDPRTRARARILGRHARDGVNTPITPGPGDPSLAAVHLHWSDDDGVTWNVDGFNKWPGDGNLAYSIPTCTAFGHDAWIGQTVAPTLDYPPPSLAVTVSRFTDDGRTFVTDATPALDGAPFFVQPMLVADRDGRVNVLTHSMQGFYFVAGSVTGGRFVRAQCNRTAIDLTGVFRRRLHRYSSKSVVSAGVDGGLQRSGRRSA